MALHGDLEQRDRDQTLVRFANGSARILVATDVAARGLDIKSLELVVNYELAQDGGACPSYWPYGARGKQRHGDQFLCAGRGAAGEYSFRNAATQAELAECARPAAVTPSGRRMATLCIDGGKKRKCVREIF